MKYDRVLWAILTGITAYSLLNLFMKVPFSFISSTMAILGGMILMFAIFINTYRTEPKILQVTGTDFIKKWIIGVVSIMAGFSSIYLELARQDPHHFAGIIDGISALYFSVNTFATVGFGDIYPISAIAKFLVTSEILAAIVVLPLTIGTSIAWIINQKITQQGKASVYELEKEKQRRLSRIK